MALREGAQNISFALNAETVKGVLTRQLSASKVAKVSHGLTLKEQVVGEGTNRQKVVVEKVAQTGAHLKKGDVIVKLGNLSLQNRFDAERALWGYKAGDQVDVTVLRGGKPTTLAITLAGSASPVSPRPTPTLTAETAASAGTMNLTGQGNSVPWPVSLRSFSSSQLASFWKLPSKTSEQRWNAATKGSRGTPSPLTSLKNHQGGRGRSDVQARFLQDQRARGNSCGLA